MAGGDTEDCFVCRKHRDRGPLVPGGPVAEDELVLVSHVVTPGALGREGATAYLGHLLVEPRRHAPGLADLTDAEARSVGWWCTRARPDPPDHETSADGPARERMTPGVAMQISGSVALVTGIYGARNSRHRS